MKILLQIKSIIKEYVIESVSRSKKIDIIYWQCIIHCVIIDEKIPLMHILNIFNRINII